MFGIAGVRTKRVDWSGCHWLQMIGTFICKKIKCGRFSLQSANTQNGYGLKHIIDFHVCASLGSPKKCNSSS